MAGFCEGGNEPGSSLKAISIVALLVNIFPTGIVTFVMTWDQFLYPRIVEVSRLGSELVFDSRFHLSVDP
ncbi:hypothetical protein ANN_26887 [Periplaneta americana]|uniref:Uncharacterized protein n=1 Tax=Periplaneta americana TaxID=6978 RepID=A0ABQ8RWN5_PERAM|nr:hypothetical protein ANN_26887 [Periplaneta americana]